jgi:hypothetical protein
MRKLPLIVMLLLISSIGFLMFFRDRQPAWIAADQVEWDRALDRLRQNYRNTAQAAAARTNNTAAAALAQSIVHSKRATLAAGASPIPPDIREALGDHFPDEILDEVRWSVAGKKVHLGSVLARWALTEGAVTMDDVVVFTSTRGTHNVRLWAHEITHAVQYRELGIRDFSRLYITNWRLLESRAKLNEDAVIAAIMDS